MNKKIKEMEKCLKGVLKRKIGITESFLVAFMIAGFFGLSLDSKAVQEGTALATNSIAIGNESKTEKTSANSVVIGNKARAIKGPLDAVNSVAIGNDSEVNSRYAVSIGNESRANAEYTVVMGNKASAQSGFSMAIGNEAETKAQYAISIGNASKASALNSIVIGRNSKAIKTGAYTPENSIAMGYSSEVNSKYAISIGNETKANSESSIAMGSHAEASGVNSIAIGSKRENLERKTDTATIANGINAIALGGGAEAVNWSLAAGTNAKSTGGTSVAIGDRANATAEYTTAIAAGSNATKENSIAVGYGTQSTAKNSIAIGYSAKANLENSVALGATTTTTKSEGKSYLTEREFANTGSVVSVGNRRINQLEDGAKDDDAVTVRQLKAAKSKLETAADSGITVKEGELTKDGTTYTVGLDKDKVKDIAGEGVKVQAGKNIVVSAETKEHTTTYTVSLDDAIESKLNNRLDGTVSLIGEGAVKETAANNIKVEKEKNGGLVVKLSDKLTGMTSFETKNDPAGKVKIDKDGISLSKDNKPTVKIGTDGTITGLKAPEIDETTGKPKDPTAAATAGYVDQRIADVKGDVKTAIDQINRNSQRVEEVNKQAKEGIAAVAAMATLDFNDAPVGRVGVGAAIGGYRGTQAVAVGAVYGINESFKVNAKMGIPTSRAKGATYGVSATYYFDR
ncbi:YadA-like family protein [Fusobacterium massiliense]|uniref:YadA C-terminal domain-containing protein n=1 Tax=Fusobacterium massiliense TaxID=1852365 RepID=UPI0028D39E94|nr:YadA-like family protein [Fusobacterium massiliense]